MVERGCMHHPGCMKYVMYQFTVNPLNGSGRDYPVSSYSGPSIFFRVDHLGAVIGMGGGGGVGVKYKKIFIPGKINKRNSGNVNK